MRHLGRGAAAQPLDARLAGDGERLRGRAIEQTREALACGAIHLGERAADQDFAIGLQGHALDAIRCAGGTRAGIERGDALDGAVGVQPREVVAELAADPAECADEDDFPVCLKGHAA